MQWHSSGAQWTGEGEGKVQCIFAIGPIVLLTAYYEILKWEGGERSLSRIFHYCMWNGWKLRRKRRHFSKGNCWIIPRKCTDEGTGEKMHSKNKWLHLEPIDIRASPHFGTFLLKTTLAVRKIKDYRKRKAAGGLSRTPARVGNWKFLLMSRRTF